MIYSEVKNMDNISYFENNGFYLMNKDKKISLFKSTRNRFGEIKFHEIEQYGKLPIGYENIQDWIKNRQAPKHRAHIEQLLRSIGCYDLDGFIRVTYALNLNDTFWICPVNKKLEWKKVSLFQNEFDETIAHIAFEGGLYGEQFTTTSPEFGTDGAFAKCWIREGSDIFLLKRGSSGARNAGLEPYSEMYASQIAKLICPESVDYEVVKYRGKLASKCKLFTSEKEGFVPIHRCVSKDADIEELMRFFAGIGSEDAFRRMLVLDALILNTDRHRGNFGVLFDTDTLNPIRMAPVFDHNQALLPYAEDEDFKKENLCRYLADRPVRIGNDFNEIAHGVLTPEIKADLKNLKGFQFDRDVLYGLPEERLIQLESILDMQINNILQDRHLYISKEMPGALQKQGISLTEKYKKQAEKKYGAIEIKPNIDFEL